MRRRRKTAGTRRPRVLVVDNSESHLEQVSDALREGGFRVVPLTRPEAMLPVATAFKPQVVVLATHAPEFSTVHMARRLHGLFRGALPIFYLLDAPDSELRRYCLERGHAVDALAKPLNLRELVAKVEAQVRLSEAVSRAHHEDAALHPAAQLCDELTGVYQARALLAFVAQELRRGERYGSNFSLVVARINGLAQRREEHGPAAAERTLVHASEVLLQTVRDSDIVARVDEDTFALLLPEMAFESLPVLLMRLTAAFEGARLRVDGRPLRTSVTLGSASFPDVVGSAAQLVAAAVLDLKRSHAVARGGSRLAL